ncbi:hypothetical protein [uncultured Nostoc sp.]|uniref:hypothetical protein n=1 Tax=uncultured Nostoc sp. TaxID=340711 RepID=UPI0035CB464D
MTLGGLEMGSNQCHHHYVTLNLTNGDRLCHSFVYDNQSTWKNFDSFGSEHEAICSEYEAIRSEYEAICSEYEAICSEYEAIRSEHEAICSEHEAIRSEYKSLRHPRKISLVKGVH